MEQRCDGPMSPSTKWRMSVQICQEEAVEIFSNDGIIPRGSFVALQGLQSNDQKRYNGCFGVVTVVPGDLVNERYVIQLSGVDSNDTKIVSVM